MKADRRASLYRRHVYANTRKVSPGRLAFGIGLGWHFAELIVGLAGAALAVGLFALLVYWTTL